MVYNEDNEGVNGGWFTGTFVLTDEEQIRFIWLMNIDSNQGEDNSLCPSVWKIFGSLIE
jgi:hypothetical protein